MNKTIRHVLFRLREAIRMSAPVSMLLYMSQNIKANFTGRLLQMQMPLNAEPKGVALCLRFLNEARYLNEWIHYYRAAGIDHFFLYNNLSDDNFTKAIAKHLDHDYITLIDWPARPASPTADEDFIRRTIGKFEWAGVLDADEFLVIKDGRSIPEYLSAFKGVPSVALHSYYFGSNGHKLRPVIPVIQAYTRRQMRPDVHVKCFVRPEAVSQNRNAHCWYYRGVKWALNENRKPVFGSLGKPTAKHAWINHYFCKSLEDYMEKSLRKSAVNGTIEQYPNRLPEKAATAFAEYNDVEDNCAISYLQSRLQAQNQTTAELTSFTSLEKYQLLDNTKAGD